MPCLFHNRSRIAVLLLLALSISLAAQTAAQPGVHPLSGRRFAEVMSYHGAPWLERPERIEEEQPDQAIAALGLEKGWVVADVGAGSGYMTVRMASRVGPSGRVYAVDIQPEMLELLERRLKREKITNIVPVLGAVDDPRLPEGAIDLILMVDVYHEFSEPQKMLRRMHAALRPGGKLVLLEYRKEDPEVPIRLEHKMTVTEAKKEIEAEGFHLTRVDSRLPRQHILIFTRP